MLLIGVLSASGFSKYCPPVAPELVDLSPIAWGIRKINEFNKGPHRYLPVLPRSFGFP